MDIYGKNPETVDWGAEVDYSDYEWFKDPPPRPEVSRPARDRGCVRDIYTDHAFPLEIATTTGDDR